MIGHTFTQPEADGWRKNDWIWTDHVTGRTASLTTEDKWRDTLEMIPGSHQIQARALHPSGQYTASTTSSFTKNGAGEIMADRYDGRGFLTNRVRTTNGQPVSTQTLYWDGRGRLWRVIER